MIRASLAYSAGVIVADLNPLLERLLAQTACDSPSPLGELIGIVPLHGDRARVTPFGQIVGGPGLDARLFTDLAKLQPDRLITPANEVFVRTEAPASVRTTPTTWSDSVPLARLQRDARSMGAHLIECSGNVDPDNFGLMSVAEWDGVPLTSVVDIPSVRRHGSALLVSGLDHPSSAARSSNPGASWIFSFDQLDRLGAFLAVTMNGVPLTPDHGAPVRLVVPGWYGCSWIKWVNELRVVGADEPSTPQMLEFARRTHQNGLPKLARDYEPPVIDLAATPIRVEKRRVNGRLEYRVVGIVWGGDRPVDRLLIRFKAGETPQPLTICPAPKTHRSWSLWEYRWQPTEPGVYDIALKAADPSIRTRRLDISFYVRRVVIDEAAGL